MNHMLIVGAVIVLIAVVIISRMRGQVAWMPATMAG